MDVSKGFGRSDTVLKILPSALFLLFLYLEKFDTFTLEYKIGWTEFFLLVLILSYPIGTIFQQFAITLREACLRNTKYSNAVFNFKYLQCDLEEFWTRYVTFYSEANPRLISMVESENLNKFFFLNMAFVTIMSLIVHISLTRQILHYIPLIQMILIAVFIKYHFQSQSYYLYIFNKATKPIKKSAKKYYIGLPPPPKPPKPPKLK
jgi:hypothetical protein